MSTTGTAAGIAERVRDFVRKDLTPHFGMLAGKYQTNQSWQRMRQLGSELWLDTGDIADAQQLWTQEFSALTTNNTLLNKEVQKGAYDGLIREAVRLLDEFGELTGRQRKLEIAFILNATHALKLVEQFDAQVSVEEHTDLAGDMELAVYYARRYHEICPERFIVKIPFTPAGLLATRELAGVAAVNHTLGFSARQNYLIARVGRPAYVNVFMGRLSSFVADNALGDGRYVGERATLASQAAVRSLRQTHNLPTMQIGASFRQGEQIRDLAGIDVMTMPPKVAREFLDLDTPLDRIVDRTGEDYRPTLKEGADPASVRLDTLWDVSERFIKCIDALEQEDLDAFTPDDLVQFFAYRGCGDVLVKWSDKEIETSANEGKIPNLGNWSDDLAGKVIGLDSLMNLAGLNSFATDQKAMDRRVAEVSGETAKQDLRTVPGNKDK